MHNSDTTIGENDICLAGAFRELCEARDSGVVQFVDRNQMCNMIDMLCTR